jgi:hypothetical protein
MKHDDFIVEVKSSKESKSSFCAYENLSIVDPIDGDRVYDVVKAGDEPDLFDIYVSTKFAEANGGVGEGCIEQLTMSLETEMPGEWWYEIQNQHTLPVECHDAPQCKIGCQAPKYVNHPYACECLSLERF